MHVLVDCPKLRELHENKLNNITSMLGGKGKEVINAVLDFVEALGRFFIVLCP
jgi:hypothetical protein